MSLLNQFWLNYSGASLLMQTYDRQARQDQPGSRATRNLVSDSQLKSRQTFNGVARTVF